MFLQCLLNLNFVSRSSSLIITHLPFFQGVFVAVVCYSCSFFLLVNSTSILVYVHHCKPKMPIPF